MDRFDAIRTLLAAVDGGSLSAASRKLGMPLPSVSRKVSELEAHLGTQLVVRTSRKLLLTDAGSAFVMASRRVLEDLEAAERTAAGEYTEPKGALVVTAPTMFGRLHALPVVNGFLAAYPDVMVQLMLTDRVAHFLDDQVDVALRIGPLPDSNLIATRLGAVRRVVCASPDYLSAHGTPAVPEELTRHSVISYEDVTSSGSWAFEHNGAELNVSFRSRLSVNTIDAAIVAGLAGAGIIRTLSYQVVDYVRSGRLQVILAPFEIAPRPVHLVYDKQGRLPLKLRAFVDFVVPRLRETVAQAEL